VRPALRETTRPASSRIRRCFITPKRVISSCDSSSVSERPSRSKSRSRRSLRVGSARALNTRSSSIARIIRDQMVTCQVAAEPHLALPGMKTVLFVGAGRHQLRAIQRAKELGIRVVAADRNPEAPGLAEADVGEVVGFDVPALAELGRENSVAGVLTVAADRA